MTMDSERARLIEAFRAWKSEIFALTREIVAQRAFSNGKDELAAILKDLPVRNFDPVLDLRISDEAGEIPRTTNAAFRHAGYQPGMPETFTGLGFDLSAHERAVDAAGRFHQGVEVSLYNRGVYDFLAKTDAEIADECTAVGSAWQGAFDAIESAPIGGMHDVLALAGTIPRGDHYQYGFVTEVTPTGASTAAHEPLAYAEVVFNALIAVEFHRFMRDCLANLDLPHSMVVIVAEHDLIYVPHTHYRLPGPAAREHSPTPPSIRQAASTPGKTAVFGRRPQRP
ncbi:hypothetical protein [Shinella sp.]|uniref:hypothetical protein n=1 Tax=Shinella sp. TaxID=1870904 RepID=UPI0040370691